MLKRNQTETTLNKYNTTVISGRKYEPLATPIAEFSASVPPITPCARVETAIVSKTGKIVATIVTAGDDARADTRLKQYEAYINRKGVEIAQDFARKRVESEISFMEIHDLNTSRLEEWLPRINFEGDRVDEVRVNIQALEGRCTQEYFKQYSKLFPDFLKTRNRYRRGAKDPPQ